MSQQVHDTDTRYTPVIASPSGQILSAIIWPDMTEELRRETKIERNVIRKDGKFSVVVLEQEDDGKTNETPDMTKPPQGQVTEQPSHSERTDNAEEKVLVEGRVGGRWSGKIVEMLR